MFDNRWFTLATYPEYADKKQKNSLRKRAKFFVMLDSKLHYIGGSGHSKKPPIPRLIIESKKEQVRLIKIIHDQGHLAIGRDKTMSQLTERYYTGQICTLSSKPASMYVLLPACMHGHSKLLWNISTISYHLAN